MIFASVVSDEVYATSLISVRCTWKKNLALWLCFIHSRLSRWCRNFVGLRLEILFLLLILKKKGAVIFLFKLLSNEGLGVPSEGTCDLSETEIGLYIVKDFHAPCIRSLLFVRNSPGIFSYSFLFILERVRVPRDSPGRGSLALGVGPLGPNPSYRIILDLNMKGRLFNRSLSVWSTWQVAQEGFL